MSNPQGPNKASTKALASQKLDARRRSTPSIDRWSAPTQLEAPPDDADYHYRWVAEAVMGNQTPQNVQSKIREGYERVLADDVPADFIFDEDKGDGYARTGGLILMRIPIEFVNQRREHYRRRSEDALHSADLMQGVAGKNAVREDRGTRTLTGADARAALATMSQS